MYQSNTNLAAANVVIKSTGVTYQFSNVILSVAETNLFHFFQQTLATLLSAIPLTARGPAQIMVYDIHALQEVFYFADNVIPRFKIAPFFFMNL